jgi:hypothetical protein
VLFSAFICEHFIALGSLCKPLERIGCKDASKLCACNPSKSPQPSRACYSHASWQQHSASLQLEGSTPRCSAKSLPYNTTHFHLFCEHHHTAIYTPRSRSQAGNQVRASKEQGGKSFREEHVTAPEPAGVQCALGWGLGAAAALAAERENLISARSK